MGRLDLKIFKVNIFAAYHFFIPLLNMWTKYKIKWFYFISWHNRIDGCCVRCGTLVNPLRTCSSPTRTYSRTSSGSRSSPNGSQVWKVRWSPCRVQERWIEVLTPFRKLGRGGIYLFKKNSEHCHIFFSAWLMRLKLRPVGNNRCKDAAVTTSSSHI